MKMSPKMSASASTSTVHVWGAREDDDFGFDVKGSRAACEDDGFAFDFEVKGSRATCEDIRAGAIGFGVGLGFEDGATTDREGGTGGGLKCKCLDFTMRRFTLGNSDA